MHIGISMSCLDHDRHTRSEARDLALKLREQFDLSSVEIILEGIGRRFAPYPWEYEEAELRELEDFVNHFQCKGAHLPFYNLNVIAVNERVREDAMEQIRLAIEIAKRLKLDYAVIHATGSTEGVATDREPRRQFLAFSRCAAFCEGSGLTLSIENATNLHDIKSCAKMIRRLKDEGLPVAMTFDTGHANIPRASQDVPVPVKQFGAMADAIESCFDIIDNIHLHNNHGSYDQHLGLLDGSIDLKSCLKRLRSLNYQGSISLEVNSQVKDITSELATLKEWCTA
ncbi:MAG: sugar phosphate isomerase/epimerase [Deltaproteobacteria bacterium]|nr:sugar phosphate isomerase/epimerase [Deltaproteobacteria bacterium]